MQVGAPWVGRQRASHYQQSLPPAARTLAELRVKLPQPSPICPLWGVEVRRKPVPPQLRHEDVGKRYQQLLALVLTARTLVELRVKSPQPSPICPLRGVAVRRKPVPPPVSVASTEYTASLDEAGAPSSPK